MNNEPVAIRYDFDGYGYQYMDSGSGSDWQTRVDGELLYTNPACKHGVDDGACKECYQEATEPLAWIKKKEIGYMEVTKKCGAKDYATNLGLVPEDDDIPLYIHPAKELTDEDVLACARRVKHSKLSMTTNEFYILFANELFKEANNG